MTGITSRSIPAWAGETETAAAVLLLYMVYPRVGGGNGIDGIERR